MLVRSRKQIRTAEVHAPYIPGGSDRRARARESLGRGGGEAWDKDGGARWRGERGVEAVSAVGCVCGAGRGALSDNPRLTAGAAERGRVCGVGASVGWCRQLGAACTDPGGATYAVAAGWV